MGQVLPPALLERQERPAQPGCLVSNPLGLQFFQGVPTKRTLFQEGS